MCDYAETFTSSVCLQVSTIHYQQTGKKGKYLAFTATDASVSRVRHISANILSSFYFTI